MLDEDGGREVAVTDVATTVSDTDTVSEGRMQLLVKSDTGYINQPEGSNHADNIPSSNFWPALTFSTVGEVDTTQLTHLPNTGPWESSHMQDTVVQAWVNCQLERHTTGQERVTHVLALEENLTDASALGTVRTIGFAVRGDHTCGGKLTKISGSSD